MAKLTSDQKRAKKKKLLFKAREQKKHKLNSENKLEYAFFRRMSVLTYSNDVVDGQVFDLLPKTTATPVYKNINSLKLSHGYSDIKDEVCLLYKLHKHSYDGGMIWQPLSSRLYVISKEGTYDKRVGISVIIKEASMKSPFDVCIDYYKDNSHECIGVVYLVGFKYRGAAVSVAFVYAGMEDGVHVFEHYGVGANGFTLIRDISVLPKLQEFFYGYDKLFGVDGDGESEFDAYDPEKDWIRTFASGIFEEDEESISMLLESTLPRYEKLPGKDELSLSKEFVDLSTVVSAKWADEISGVVAACRHEVAVQTRVAADRVVVAARAEISKLEDELKRANMKLEIGAKGTNKSANKEVVKVIEVAPKTPSLQERMSIFF
jgi:hypothetical protein